MTVKFIYTAQITRHILYQALKKLHPGKWLRTAKERYQVYPAERRLKSLHTLHQILTSDRESWLKTQRLGDLLCFHHQGDRTPG
jgi:hypothetical protein